MVCVLGNHDSAACGLSEPDTFSPLARHAVLWTRAQLAAPGRAFLQGLPREMGLPDLFLCHGAIHDTDRYLLRLDDLRETFSLMHGLPGSPRTCFHGHTHLQTAFSAEEGTPLREPGDDLRLDGSRRYLINPGAVGQPRDGDPRAAYVVYDPEARLLTYYRLFYDVETAQRKIRRSGLPPLLADRLALGR
jgi:diadenosine tetraphosphatase ApaH/serine/threonine PP2A family protein phosphatase